MKKIDVGQSIGILANISVLVGILLLVYQLDQNRLIMQAQTRTVLAQGVTDILYRLSVDDDVSEVWDRGNAGDELTATEAGRFTRLVLSQLRYQENVHYQYRAGLYDDIEFAAQREAWRRAYNTPGASQVWCTVRTSFSPEFADEITKLLRDGCPGVFDE